MNLKHFLRGLGTGIIFGTLIMLVAYMTTGGYKISDEEIIDRAKKLGMVATEKENDTEETKDTEKATISIAEITTEAATDEMTETENTSEEITSEASTEASTEAVSTDAATEETTPSSSEEQPGTIVKATITVTAGMGSQNVARLLQDAGIISDASDFDNFLVANGYATKIEIGTYEFNNGMSYQDIAEELTKKR